VRVKLSYRIVSYRIIMELLLSITVSRVASARYRRCSLSHDILLMCGWRSLSQYGLIDNPYLLDFVFLCFFVSVKGEFPNAVDGYIYSSLVDQILH